MFISNRPCKLPDSALFALLKPIVKRKSIWRQNNRYKKRENVFRISESSDSHGVGAKNDGWVGNSNITFSDTLRIWPRYSSKRTLK